MKHERFIKLQGAFNFRDIGGYTAKDGRKVKWGKLYRSGSLAFLTKSDVEEMERRRITVDCDLRSSGEQLRTPDKRWNGVKFVSDSFYSEGNDTSVQKKLIEYQDRLPKIKSYLGRSYQRVILSSGPQFSIWTLFNEMLNLPEDEALVYHCAMGKDRTGMMTVMILMCLGLNDKEIMRDYLLSGYTNEVIDDDGESELDKKIDKMNHTQVTQADFYGLTETVRAVWGDFNNFFEYLGFENGDLEKLRDKYLE